FERARDIGIVAFDKTGTLTEGKFAVNTIAAHGLEEQRAMAIIAALETRSEHPLAQAVLEEAHGLGLSVPDSDEFRVVAGKGVQGRVEGATYYVGRPEWIGEQELELPPELLAAISEAEERGESVIALMNEERALA